MMNTLQSLWSLCFSIQIYSHFFLKPNLSCRLQDSPPLASPVSPTGHALRHFLPTKPHLPAPHSAASGPTRCSSERPQQSLHHTPAFHQVIPYKLQCQFAWLHLGEWLYFFCTSKLPSKQVLFNKYLVVIQLITLAHKLPLKSWSYVMQQVRGTQNTRGVEETVLFR